MWLELHHNNSLPQAAQQLFTAVYMKHCRVIYDQSPVVTIFTLELTAGMKFPPSQEEEHSSQRQTVVTHCRTVADSQQSQSKERMNMTSVNRNGDPTAARACFNKIHDFSDQLHFEKPDKCILARLANICHS